MRIGSVIRVGFGRRRATMRAAGSMGKDIPTPPPTQRQIQIRLEERVLQILRSGSAGFDDLRLDREISKLCFDSAALSLLHTVSTRSTPVGVRDRSAVPLKRALASLEHYKIRRVDSAPKKAWDRSRWQLLG